MPSRIVVFGATGYTGRLTAEQLVAQGERPVLAGRSEARCASSPSSSAGWSGAGRRRRAPGDRRGAAWSPATCCSRRVGPFKQWGEPALRAAIGAGARVHRLDRRAAVHPARVRRVRPAGARAPARRCCPPWATTSCPGRWPARSRWRRRATTAVRVDVGYYALGGGPQALSRGTRASLAGVALDRAFAYRGGRVQTVRSAERVRGFPVRGKQRPAISVGGVGALHAPGRLSAACARSTSTSAGSPGASRAVQASSRVSAARHAHPGHARARSRGRREARRHGRPGRRRARRRGPRPTSSATRTTRAASSSPRSTSPARTRTTSPRAASPGRRAARRTRASWPRARPGRSRRSASRRSRPAAPRRGSRASRPETTKGRRAAGPSSALEPERLPTCGA